MISVAKGQVLPAGASPLEVFIAADARLVDVAALEFAVFSSGTQIFPAAAGSPLTFLRQSVDVAGVNHLHLGHYCAAFTMPSNAPTGLAEIRWYYKITSGGAEQTITIPIGITASAVTAEPGYCLIPDLREEGLTEAAVPDARVGKAISRASRFLEKATGDRWFEPRRRVFTLDGTQTCWLPLPEPIIAIESVVLTYDGDFSNQDPVDPGVYRIYARHLTDAMVGEDDRNNPKLEMYDSLLLPRFLTRSMWWIKGHRNIKVTGVFGYTDPDGSPAGKTPDLIRQACVSIAIDRTEKLTEMSARTGPVTMEKTRDQEVQYMERAFGNITGDLDVDQIIEAYHRPMRMLAV